MALAWVGALIVGLSLGLLGSGGSILTVPILVYLVGQPDKVAIAGSLAIVGGIAVFGAANYARQGLVVPRFVVLFGLPGVAGTYAGALTSSHVTGAVQLVVFAVIMALAAYSMLKPDRAVDGVVPSAQGVLVLVASGAGVGVITGFVGVGGGFLLVPALVLLGGLDMHRAVGTSLAIIVLNSAAGFYKHLGLLAGGGGRIDWAIIILFLLLGIAGNLAGNFLLRRLPQGRLRTGFGWFLVVMAIYILVRTGPQVL
ncbi:MAG TPA: sulfite exporter TauE/SafE family protein [Gammaproteobacteria bacterium]|nr:sulfite exporter TauE/SafE family protein [Gammaproteobacteria bacterium]